jgi:DNA-directed RNA polymerase specialized sigma24 family protein
VSTHVDETAFPRLVERTEPRLREALTALYGAERGREATMEALNWAFESVRRDGGPGGRYDDTITLRRLFAEAQARSFSLRAAPAFDDPAKPQTGIDRRLAGLLSVMPRQDRVAILLTEGAGWAIEDVAALFSTSEPRILHRGERWLGMLREAVEPDDLGAVLHGLFAEAEAVGPVSVEEAMNPELARKVADHPPELAATSHRVRLLKVLATSIGVLVLLVGGIVIALDATRATTDRGYTTPGSEPAPGLLEDSVLVIPNPPQIVGARPGLRAVYELDAGTRRLLRTPAAPGVAATSIPVTSGSWLVDVEYRSPQSGGTGGAGEAVSWRSGSAKTRHLGLASSVYPGVQAGTFWLDLHGVTPNGQPTRACSVRLVTADGRQLVRPTVRPCSWQVLGAVEGGLLILSRTGVTEVWNATTRVTDPLPGFAVASVKTGGRTLMEQQWNHFCSVTCRITLASPSTGALALVHVIPPRGLSLTDQSALSPNGQFLAVTAMPIDVATTLYDQPIVGPSAPTEEVHGELVVVRVSTGEVALARPVTYLQPSVVAWAPDGSYVFLTRSRTDVEAVPVWALSAPIETIHIPAGATNPPNPGERFLVVGR